MAVLNSLIRGLKRAERELAAQLGSVRAAIVSLAGGALSGKRRGRPAGSKNKSKDKGIIIVSGKKRRRRKLSAAARKRISDAQKKRWAKQRATAKEAK